jgi:methyl-accepting chemotaxis protein
MIIVSGNGRQAGVRWGGIGFDDNIARNLQGKSSVSSPMKAPDGVTVVTLVTAPIMEGDKVTGIMGLPVNLGRFSQSMIGDIKIGKTGYTFLCDKNGVIFAHPNTKLIFNLKLREADWSRPLMAMASETDIKYMFEGKSKYAHRLDSKDYNILYFSSGYVSDVTDQALLMVIIMVSAALIIMTIAGFLVFLFIRKRLSPLQKAKELADELASGDGDLTRRIEVTSKDEIGELVHSFNVFIENTHDLILNIKNGARNLTEAVHEIASGNENLSQRTSEQASSLEEIASTIEESTASISHNADTAAQTKTVTDDTVRLAQEGGDVVLLTAKAMNELSGSSARISEIVNVINDIAFQTNLLALNASVEAARAGEQGRGFAVVAGEVRNLAQRTANSSREISSLIGESLDRVTRGNEYSDKSGEALKRILESLKKVSLSVEEIYSASLEQKQGVGQINSAVSQLDSMTQQNASLVEETASASEEMSQHAQELMAMISRFKLKENIKAQVRQLSGPRNMEDKKPHNDGKNRKAEAPERTESGNTAPKAGDDLGSIMSADGFEEF